VPLELGIGLSLAYLLRRNFPGRSLVRVALLMPWLVGPVANGVMWHFLLNSNVGLLNAVLGAFGLPVRPSPLGGRDTALITIILTDVWRTAGLASFLLLPGILSIPSERWEQAVLDGAGLVDRIRYIVLPSLRPVLLALAMLLTGQALGVFDGIWVLTGGGPGTATVTPGLLSFQAAFVTNQWQLGAVYAWWISACVVLVGSIYVRLARGREGR